MFNQDVLESSSGRSSVRSGATEALRYGAGDPRSQRSTIARTTTDRRAEKPPLGGR